MLALRNAVLSDIPHIIHIAEAAWFVTYLPFIEAAQVQFMFDAIYNPEALATVMQQEGAFSLLAFDESHPAGFAIASPAGQPEGVLKISKIYVKPEMQGKKVGKQLMQATINLAKHNNFRKLLLNVNRFNEKAIIFYEKCNFAKTAEEDIPIGDYWMNDFVMELVL